MDARSQSADDDAASLFESLALRFGRRLPVILQTEGTECGLACLAMVLGFQGYRTDLASLRSRFHISQKGASLEHLMQIADALGLATRAVRLELEDLSKLRTPCILHWEFKHFVVLKEVRGQSIVIHDPATGRRTIRMREASRLFTGVALELWRKADFRPRKEQKRVTLRQLLGRISGLVPALAQILLLSFSLEIFAVLSPLFVQWVVDNVVIAADRDLLTTLAIGFALLMVVQQIVTGVRSWFSLYLGTTLNVRGRAGLLAHLLKLPVQFFEKRHLGDLISRFGSIDQIQRLLTTGFLEAILDGLMAVITLVVMFVYSRTLAWIAVAAIALYCLARWAWYRALFEATGSQIVFAARQQTHFLESMRGIRTIKLFQREQTRRNSWLSLFVDQTNAGIYQQRLQILYELAHGLLAGVQNILIIWFGARLVMAGEFTVGALMAFTAYNNQFNSRISGVIDKFVQFRLLNVYKEWLGDIVLAEPERQAGAALQGAADGSGLEPSIRVIDARYRYGEGDDDVLRGVDLEIRAGESVAITGPSGCGKSTLISLILGIRHPTSGDVQIGGVSVSRLKPHTLRSIIATVMQEDVLFAGTLADNITFFDPHADRSWMEECARMASIHTDILKMPMGYHSLVGDMGTVFSGGQKQRVLLARALYKRPKILILDEATSHLDVERERQVNEGLKAQQFTRLIVAHRPETIAAADRCITMVDGRVVEQNRRDSSTGPGPASQPVSPRGAPAYLDPMLALT